MFFHVQLEINYFERNNFTGFDTITKTQWRFTRDFFTKSINFPSVFVSSTYYIFFIYLIISWFRNRQITLLNFTTKSLPCISFKKLSLEGRDISVIFKLLNPLEASLLDADEGFYRLVLHSGRFREGLIF